MIVVLLFVAFSAESSALGALRCSCYLEESSTEFLECVNDVKRNFKSSDDEEFLKFLNKITTRLETTGAVMVDKECLGKVLDHEKIKYQDFLYDDGDQSDSDDSSDSNNDENEKIDTLKVTRRAPRAILNHLGEFHRKYIPRTAACAVAVKNTTLVANRARLNYRIRFSIESKNFVFSSFSD